MTVLAGLALLVAGCSANTATQSVETPNAQRDAGSRSDAAGQTRQPYQAPTVGPDGWVTFEHEDKLGNSSVVDLKGKRTDKAGCAFGGELTLRPGQPVVMERQVALQPDTCEARVERGVPPQTLLDRLAKTSDKETKTDRQEATRSGEVGPNGDVGNAVHSAGYLKSYWEDPVKRDVNSVEDSTDWYWTGSAVVSPVYGGYQYGWFALSGWSLQEANWRNVYNNYESTSSSYAHFFNSVFCAFVDTHAYYNRNTVNGRSNGDLVGTWHSEVQGGCTSLLSFGRVLQRTLN